MYNVFMAFMDARSNITVYNDTFHLFLFACVCAETARIRWIT